MAYGSSIATVVPGRNLLLRPRKTGAPRQVDFLAIM